MPGDAARLIPAGNLRVPFTEFVKEWAHAEDLTDMNTAAGRPDWYVAGVVVTCRWLACAVVRPESGRAYLAHSPVLRTGAPAEPELIEREYLAMVELASRELRPTWLMQRPGWIEGTEHTFAWAWKRTMDRPLLNNDQPDRAPVS